MLKTIEKVLLLQDVAMFRYATTEHLSELSAICREKRLEAGHVLFETGGRCFALHLLIKGRMALEGPGSPAEEVQGGALDFWAFFAQGHHRVRAETREESILFELPYDDFLDILAAEPEFSTAILKFLARAGRELQDALDCD